MLGAGGGRLGPRKLAEEHAVSSLDIDLLELAVVADHTLADSDDLSLLRLLLGGVGNDDASGGGLLIDALDEDPSLKRTDPYGDSSRSMA